MCKQLLPVYDKPMIYYSLTTLMLAGIHDMIVITTAEDIERFRALLQDGRQWGIRISYAVQAKPNGVAEALIIGADFIGGEPLGMILGDNLFYGAGLSERVQRASARLDGATVSAYWVADSSNYGIVDLDPTGKPLEIREKPSEVTSNWAVTGLYFYDADAVKIAQGLSPSERGELEITDVNRNYLARNKLHVEVLSRGYAWLDAGTHTSLLQAAQYVSVVEERQNLKIGCPEEVAYRMGYIGLDELGALATRYPKSEYGQYLRRLVDLETAQQT
jgi:glucose-1-phosphate thymidylyltransferase